MKIDEAFKIPLVKIPEEIKNLLSENEISKTSFENKNEVISKEELQGEVGYTKNSDGSFLVSMVCPMPNVDEEMINWWFWWHPQASERYKVWFPGEHFAVGYSKKDREYFSQKTLPKFKSNTQYPFEKIGKIIMPLAIKFVSPKEFGFSENLLEENNIATVVCGHVGALKGLVMHTEMAHIFKKTDKGLVLISRFWIGQTLKNPILRKLILNEKTARSMAEHCCVEYRRLAQLLPGLYETYNR